MHATDFASRVESERSRSLRVAGSSKPQHRSRRSVVQRLVAVLAVLLSASYLGISAYLLDVALTPTRLAIVKTPDHYGLAFEPIQFESANDHLPLKGWILPARGSQAIVMIHGIDGNRSDGSALDVAKAYVERGFTVLLYDSRASGESGGRNHGLGWFERNDVRSAVDLLTARGFKPGSIGAHGTSFGAATALLATAAIPEIGAVMAECSWSDARPLFDQEQERKTGLPPIFTQGMAFWFLVLHRTSLDEITPARAIAVINPRPVFLIHGDADTRIPIDHGYRLKAASPDPKTEIWILSGVEHAKAYENQPQEYVTRVSQFFERSLRR